MKPRVSSVATRGKGRFASPRSYEPGEAETGPGGTIYLSPQLPHDTQFPPAPVESGPRVTRRSAADPLRA